jgi:hypothetical protein
LTLVQAAREAVARSSRISRGRRMAELTLLKEERRIAG